jgi:hypothetical protein
VRFQDAARDARAVVYAGIQADPLVARVASLMVEATSAERWMARAVMNGERTDADTWRRMFPALFGPAAPALAHAEDLLRASLEVANRGEAARSQYRGAIVEELTARLLAARPASGTAGPVKRERRVLFDGIPAEIHPYDVTVESPERPEVYDCKWGARGINADVLNQLDDARSHAADEDIAVSVAIVVFDARRSCQIRLDRSTANRSGTRLVALEELDGLRDASR